MSAYKDIRKTIYNNKYGVNARYTRKKYRQILTESQNNMTNQQDDITSLINEMYVSKAQGYLEYYYMYKENLHLGEYIAETDYYNNMDAIYEKFF